MAGSRFGDVGAAVEEVRDRLPVGLGDGADQGSHLLGLFGGDREADVVTPADVGDVMAVEPGIGTQRQRPGGPGSAHPVERFGQEVFRSPAGVGVAATQAGMHDLTGAGDGGEHGVVATHTGVAEHAALFGEPVGLTDRRVDIDRQCAGAGTGAGLPGPDEYFAGDGVELADMAPGEAAQERAQRRWRQHRVAEHRGGVAGPQRVGVTDAISVTQRRVDQRHRLVPDVGCTHSVQRDPVTEQLTHLRCWARVAGSTSPASATAWSSSKVTSKRSRVWQDRIEKVPSLTGINDCEQQSFSQVKGTF